LNFSEDEDLLKEIVCILLCLSLAGCGTGTHESKLAVISSQQVERARLIFYYPVGELSNAAEWEIPKSRIPRCINCLLTDCNPHDLNGPKGTISSLAKAGGTLVISLQSGEEIEIDICSPLFFWGESRFESDAFTSESLDKFLLNEIHIYQNSRKENGVRTIKGGER